MILNTCYHTVVVRQDFTSEWVCRAYTFKHGIVTAGRNVIEACVSFADNRFPNQNLSGISVGDTVCVAFILRLPACRNTSTVAVLQDATDKQANIIAGNRSVRADVIKEVLVLFGESISCPLSCTRLNTVGDIARIRTHCTKSCIFRGQAFPTVHIVEIAVSPFAVVIGISASGIIDEVHIGFFAYGCKGCRCPNAHKSSKAHNRRQHKRDGFLEFCFNHCVFLLEMQKRTDFTQCVRLKLFCFSSSRYRCCTPYRIAFLSISTQR